MNDAPLPTAATAALMLLAITAASACASMSPPAGYDHQACVENALRRRPDPSLLADAAAELKQGCGIGDSASCSMLGVMYELGRGVRQSRRTALVLYRRGCDAGNGRACGNLGELLLGDSAREPALALLRVACDAGQPRACMVLGRVETGAPPAIVAARLARACDGGEGQACVELAKRLAATGIPADGARASSLFEVACAQGEEEGCARLGARSQSAPIPPPTAILAKTQTGLP